MESLILSLKREENLKSLSEDTKEKRQDGVTRMVGDEKVFQENLTLYQISNPHYMIY